MGNVKTLDSVRETSSPRILRRLNSRRILDHAWAVEAFTATDAMRVTGLTRATVIGVCDELVTAGIFAELGDARAVGDYSKGRPARRYSLRSDAGIVVGVDAGYDRMTAVVTDLRGRVLGRASVEIPAHSPTGIGRLADSYARRSLARRVADEAIRTSGMSAQTVLALTVGVPAPVDSHGGSPVYDGGFWQLMNPGFSELFDSTATIVSVDNDANLVALAERAFPTGLGRDVDSFIALIASEGIGAGIMVDGRLIRGRRGGAGEMRFLDHVTDVASANGLSLCARQWATEAIASGTLPADSTLRLLHPDSLTERDVAAAAEAGDMSAKEIIYRLAARLAKICAILGDLLDVDRVIVSGSTAQAMPAVVAQAHALLASSPDPSTPELVASALGSDAVARGAVEHALANVRGRALELFPAERAPSPIPGG